MPRPLAELPRRNYAMVMLDRWKAVPDEVVLLGCGLRHCAAYRNEPGHLKSSTDHLIVSPHPRPNCWRTRLAKRKPMTRMG